MMNITTQTISVFLGIPLRSCRLLSNELVTCIRLKGNLNKTMQILSRQVMLVQKVAQDTYGLQDFCIYYYIILSIELESFWEAFQLVL